MSARVNLKSDNKLIWNYLFYFYGDAQQQQHREQKWQLFSFVLISDKMNVRRLDVISLLMQFVWLCPHLTLHFMPHKQNAQQNLYLFWIFKTDTWLLTRCIPFACVHLMWIDWNLWQRFSDLHSNVFVWQPFDYWSAPKASNALNWPRMAGTRFVFPFYKKV